VPEAVGAFVAEQRREHGLTLDQIARVARAQGASWSASSIGNIERGQASLSLTAMLQLALALGSLTGRDLKLSDLLGDAEALLLGSPDQSAMKRAWFDRALAGAAVTVSADDLDWSEADDRGDDLAGEVAFADMQRARLDQLVEQSRTPREPPFSRSGSLAEERAAKRLGIPVARLQALAEELWSRPLEDESHRRAGPGSTPQSRGRVTRVLVDELRARLEAE